MIKLLLTEVLDRYVRENFKTIEEELNKATKVVSHPNYSDSTRPMSGLTKGDTIYNTDDGQLNIWDGTQWTTPDGAAT